jgi:hypothetical protein
MVARSLRRELARHHFPKAQTILAEIGIVIRRCNWPGRLPAERIPNGVAPSPPEAQTLLTAWQMAFPICAACDARTSKAAIYCLTPRPRRCAYFIAATGRPRSPSTQAGRTAAVECCRRLRRSLV